MSKSDTDINSRFGTLKNDIPAGLVVFLVALPLCLGIALASGAPLLAGIISGALGGLLVPMFSKSELSVAGPAAGLTSLVLAGIQQLQGYEKFLLAAMLAGGFQVILGLFKAGKITYIFPTAVIKGMLAGIGIILIINQLPYLFGYDVQQYRLDKVALPTASDLDTFIIIAQANITVGSIFFGIFSFVILITWQQTRLKKLSWMPGPLAVVIFGIAGNELLQYSESYLALQMEQHLVNLPHFEKLTDITVEFVWPDYSSFGIPVLEVAFTLGLVASLETLLTLEAVDQVDPYKRQSEPNRELIAQGLANIISASVGGLPITSVIVRSSVAINSGGIRKWVAVTQGVFLGVSVLFLSQYLNKIPLSCLAAILVMTGYKLADPAFFKQKYKEGWDQLVPFVMTIVAIVWAGLLVGVLIGICFGVAFVILINFHSTVKVTRPEPKLVVITLVKDVSFLNKFVLRQALDRIENGSKVLIDASNAKFIDHDILQVIESFKNTAATRNIELQIKNLSVKRFSFRFFQAIDDEASE
ncbi:MAG: SulP family inorganic anion transporter [Cytophagales bacterium]|nr:MAG: SulP family inorganic anion transporter [Cytophagales bacterium]